MAIRGEYLGDLRLVVFGITDENPGEDRSRRIRLPPWPEYSPIGLGIWTCELEARPACDAGASAYAALVIKAAIR